MARKRFAVFLVLLSVLVLTGVLLHGHAVRFAFSRPSGFYDEPFLLEIQAPSREVYYTLDGSEPDRTSLQYTKKKIPVGDASENENTLSAREDLDSYGQDHPEMIDTQIPEEKVDKCTVIKAVYYDAAGNKSETICASYFVGFQHKTGYGTTKVVSLVTDPENLTDYDTGIFVRGRTYDELKEGWGDQAPGNYSNKGREWEREAIFQYFGTDGKLLYETDCGIRIMGGWHRKAVIKSFNLYAREEYGGSNEFDYDFWGTGYDPHKITLHSGSNDYYGKVQNMLVSDLTRGLSYGTMHYELCLVFLNGEYWGIYNLTEKYDKTYISETYHVKKRDVLSVKAGKLENGEEENFNLYEDAMEFVENADMTQEENYRRFQELFDEQSLLDLYAVEIYCGRNYDWPKGNIHLWRTVTEGGPGYADGKWRYLLYDMDSSGLTRGQLTLDTVQTAMDDSGFFRSLCRNETFRKKLGADILRIGREYLTGEKVSAYIDEYEAWLTEPMKTYFQRFFNSDETKFHERLQSNRDFFNGRLEIMEKILAEHDMLP